MAKVLARWWMTVNPIALGHSHCGQVGERCSQIKVAVAYM